MADYNKAVVELGDAHSHQAHDAVKIANDQLSDVASGGVLRDGTIMVGENAKGVLTSIDGVGTKVKIYLNKFESLVLKFQRDKADSQNSQEELYSDLVEKSTELWFRMFHDLIAMNVDDLRGGEIGKVFTNIVDINTLDGFRGNVFTTSFKLALGKAIEDVGIASGNGETAVLGENAKFLENLADFIGLRKRELKMVGKRRNNLEQLVQIEQVPEEIITSMQDDIDSSKGKIKEIRRKLFQRYRQLDFNIGGTGEGLVLKNEKLTELKALQKVIYLQEKPTKDGIIGPRSNGITRIREMMHNFVGAGWESLTFEEFCEKIGPEKASLIPQDLTTELYGLEMWDIATGMTTVFNPYISRRLLGGEKGNPIGNISALAHITGNPGRKLADSLKGEDRFALNIDLSNVKIPQIMVLLQILGELSDEKAMGSWNMGIPYVIICDENDAKNVIKDAKEAGFVAGDIGEVIERDLKENNTLVNLKGVGFNKSSVKYKEEIDRDVPELPERYKHLHAGKVRETYEHPDYPDQMILIATDRISTHDVVHKSLIPGKGASLTQISNFWFRELKTNPETANIRTHIVENPVWPADFPEELKEKAVIVQKLKALPIEAIVRGYLYGSALDGYDAETGKLKTGQFVGEGLQKCSKFETPMFTPSTKSDSGDVNIDFDNMPKYLSPWLEENGYKNINATVLAKQIKELSIKIYNFGNKKANERGHIIGDTKFEFGLDQDGNIIVIDEVMTPDSSRFWQMEGFEEGKEPDASDKQPVRDYVMANWKKKTRLDRKKYPQKLDKDAIKRTQTIYAKMRIQFT